jgi:hypothetical protein
MWEYLRRVYYQESSARKYHPELEIAKFNQGNLTIQQFYTEFINLWSEFSGIVSSTVPQTAIAAFRDVHASSQRDQFLMKLRPEFENVRAGLLNRSPVLSLDVWVNYCMKNNVCQHNSFWPKNPYLLK